MVLNSTTSNFLFLKSFMRRFYDKFFGRKKTFGRKFIIFNVILLWLCVKIIILNDIEKGPPFSKSRAKSGMSYCKYNNDKEHCQLAETYKNTFRSLAQSNKFETKFFGLKKNFWPKIYIWPKAIFFFVRFGPWPNRI